MIELRDDGIVLAGYTSRTGMDEPDWYLLKVNRIGFYEWDVSVGSDHYDELNSVSELYDGSLIVGGYMRPASGGPAMSAYSRFSASGEELWNVLNRDWRVSNVVTLAATSDSNFVCLNECKMGRQHNFNVLLQKFTPEGNLLWAKFEKSDFNEIPSDVFETYSRDYVVAFTSSDMSEYFADNLGAMCFSQDGKLLWKGIYPTKSEDHSAEIIEDIDDGLLISASTRALNEPWSYGLLKFKFNRESDLFFLSPMSDTASITNNVLPLKVALNGRRKPKKIDVFTCR